MELFTHEYFWLSFFPMVTLSALVWLLWFDRRDSIREPLLQLFLALVAGGISAGILLVWLPDGIGDFWFPVFIEEVVKVVAAIGLIELFARRFTFVSQGTMYGFAVGLGFAFTENLIYLIQSYEVSQFSADFWLVFQGRFWSATLLHGTTMAVFGTFYAGAYLECCKHKAQRESPWRSFFIPPTLKQLSQILTFHVAREHLLWNRIPTLRGHAARTVVLEGMLLAIILHASFNGFLNAGITGGALALSAMTLYLVSRKSSSMKN